MCDVALDPYTTHGHDGLLKKNEIVNDETVENHTFIFDVQMTTKRIAPAAILKQKNFNKRVFITRRDND